MDILETIIKDITSKNIHKWKQFDDNKEAQFDIAQTRKPLIPRIMDPHNDKDNFFLIAEIKRASPSQGIIKKDFDPLAIAQLYVSQGVDAISILTEETHFKGSLQYLQQVRNYTHNTPLLRKDFIVHPYQVQEAYLAGADMVLLIVACLSDEKLAYLYQCIEQLGMTALIEIHSKEELDRALRIDPKLIGINNRDLRTFEVNLHTTFDLIVDIPSHIKVISESGIASKEDTILLKEHGVAGCLVGQSILETQNPQELIRALKNI